MQFISFREEHEVVMGISRWIAIILLMLTVTATASIAEDKVQIEHKFSPNVLTTHGDWTLSLDYNLGISMDLWTQPSENSFRKNLSASFSTNGALAANPDLNTTPLTTKAGIVTSVSLYRPSIVKPGPNPGEIVTKERGFNCGRMSLGLQGGYETDQRLDNRNYTGGVEIGYALTENNGYKALVPSLFFGYDMVFVDHSKLQQTLGIDDESSQRIRMFGSWKIPFGQWLSDSLAPLNAHVDARYYRSYETSSAMQSVEKDEAVYVAGALSYNFNQPLWKSVNAAFVRVANGRIPPMTNEATTVIAGFTLWEK